MVIGGGIGYFGFRNYKKKNSKITIIEEIILPMGASTKNAGFACFGSISEIENDRKKMPDLDLLSLIELRVLGLKKLRNVLGDKNISFSKFGGYELFLTKKNRGQSR